MADEGSRAFIVLRLAYRGDISFRLSSALAAAARSAFPPRVRYLFRMRRLTLSISIRSSAAIALALVFACSSKSDGPAPRTAAVLAPLSNAAALTDTVTLVLQHPISASIEPLSPDDPTQLDQLLQQGFGSFTTGPGEESPASSESRQ